MKIRAVVTDSQALGAVAVAERDLPEPAPGARRVRVKAFSLNRGELRAAGQKPAGTPIGWDIAGELDDGTRVVGFSRAMEGWAEAVNLPESDFATVPESVSLEAASALPVAAGTALACIDAAGPGLLGHRVLITGVTGGVGGFAVRLARLAGAHVVAQVRSADQSEYAKSLGADDVVVTGDGAGFEGMEPVRAFFDGIGGSLLEHGLKVLDADGVGVSYGLTGAPSFSLPVGVLLGKGRAKLRGLNLYAVSERLPPRQWLGRLLRLVADGRLPVDVEVRGDWSNIGAAADDLLERRFRGKAVLQVP